MKKIDELPAVWALRRKRKMSDRSVTKYKARLNIDGSRQIKGVHYQESWAPVATWSTIRLMNTWAIINNWKAIHIYFVQAFPQAPIEREINMQIPRGYTVMQENNQTKLIQTDDIDDHKWASQKYTLKLLRNLYGQVQAGKVWKTYLTNKLLHIGFIPSKTEECVFYSQDIIYILYTDDSILIGKNMNIINKTILKMKQQKLNLTVLGDVQ